MLKLKMFRLRLLEKIMQIFVNSMSLLKTKKLVL